MELWILGEIVDKGSGDEASLWNLYGIFLSRDEALWAYGRILSDHPEHFFILPVKTGELLMEDIAKFPGIEFLKIN